MATLRVRKACSNQLWISQPVGDVGAANMSETSEAGRNGMICLLASFSHGGEEQFSDFHFQQWQVI
eukprot:2644492-Heterocapsa_arctica.AAC.1